MSARHRKGGHLSTREIWTVPILLGFVTMIGLIAALLANGIGDWVSWLALAIPVATTLVCLQRSR
ncbi:MAG: hypothetical protein R3200_09445 [Xanthomonadales bacterium]|nr:hypothetical protein [Xanthomonadales bacterium]